MEGLRRGSGLDSVAQFRAAAGGGKAGRGGRLPVPEQPALEKGAHVAPFIHDQVNVDVLIPHPVDTAAGFHHDLAILPCPQPYEPFRSGSSLRASDPSPLTPPAGSSAGSGTGRSPDRRRCTRTPARPVHDGPAQQRRRHTDQGVSGAGPPGEGPRRSGAVRLS
jgi:hypothetical protein